MSTVLWITWGCAGSDQRNPADSDAGQGAEAGARLARRGRRHAPPLAASFDQWFTGVQFDGIEHGVLSLTARDEFVRDWVKEHFLPDLLDTLWVASGASRRSGLAVRWAHLRATSPLR